MKTFLLLTALLLCAGCGELPIEESLREAETGLDSLEIRLAYLEGRLEGMRACLGGDSTEIGSTSEGGQ